MERQTCIKCGKPKEDGEECPYCGVYYAKAEHKTVSEKHHSKTKDTAANRWKTLPKSDKDAVKKVGVWALAAIIVFAIWAWPASDNKKESPNKTQHSTTKTSGAKKHDLGTLRSSLSSNDQAHELVNLIKEFPEKNSYQITYKTANDIVIFGCNFDQDVLVRMHNYTDGSGSTESWTGNIEYRLSQAAAGGSLNDTPNGKQPGTFARF